MSAFNALGRDSDLGGDQPSLEQYRLCDVDHDRDTILYGQDGYTYVWSISGSQGRVDESGDHFYASLLPEPGTLLSVDQESFSYYAEDNRLGFKLLPPNMAVEDDGTMRVGRISIPLPDEGTVLRPRGGVVYRVHQGRLERDESASLVLGADCSQNSVTMSFNVPGQQSNLSVLLLPRDGMPNIGLTTSRLELRCGGREDWHITSDIVQQLNDDSVFEVLEVRDVESGQTLGVFERVPAATGRTGSVEWARRGWPFSPGSGNRFVVDMQHYGEGDTSFAGRTLLQILPDGRVQDLTHKQVGCLTPQHMQRRGLYASGVEVHPVEGEPYRIDDFYLDSRGFSMSHNPNDGSTACVCSLREPVPTGVRRCGRRKLRRR